MRYYDTISWNEDPLECFNDMRTHLSKKVERKSNNY